MSFMCRTRLWCVWASCQPSETFWMRSRTTLWVNFEVNESRVSNSCVSGKHPCQKHWQFFVDLVYCECAKLQGALLSSLFSAVELGFFLQICCFDIFPHKKNAPLQKNNNKRVTCGSKAVDSQENCSWSGEICQRVRKLTQFQMDLASLYLLSVWKCLWVQPSFAKLYKTFTFDCVGCLNFFFFNFFVLFTDWMLK